MSESITDGNKLEFTNSGVSHVKMVATNAALTCSSTSGDIDLLGIKDIHISGTTNVIDIITAGTITMNDNINMSMNKIINMSNPILSNDGVNKIYSDTKTDLNILNLANHIIFMGGWKEYKSNVITKEVINIPNPTELSFLETPSGEYTELYVDTLGTYRITFSAQYSISTGERLYKIALNNLIINLLANTFTAHAAEYGGTTLLPGNYSNAGATTHTGVLNLDAEGDVNAVFIIKSAGAHAIAINATTNLINGAQSCNVFWIISGAIGIAAGCTLVGTYIATLTAISAGIGLQLDGRLLTTGGAVALTTVSATAPVGSSPYTDDDDLKYMLFYTAAGAVSTTGYTLIGTTVWEINTDLGIISGFGQPIDGSYPSIVPPLIHAVMCICIGDIMIMPSSYNLFQNVIGENYTISLGHTVLVNDEIEKRISVHVRITTILGGITFGTRSLFAMPLVEIT
jgi:hypothetical protein